MWYINMRAIIIIRANFINLQEVNEEWLADKSRFAYDGLKRQRLTVPMIKDTNGELKAIEWEDILVATARELNVAQNKVNASSVK